MAKVTKTKKHKFVPKLKATLTPAPNWDKLQKARTEEARMFAWNECESFVHHEVTDREYLHSMKKWLKNESGWGVEHLVTLIPDTYLVSLAKHGWKAIKLGFIPEQVKDSLHKILLPLLLKAEDLRKNMVVEPLIHPSVSEKDEDHVLHPSKVKEWIVATQAWLKGNKHYKDSSDSDQRQQYITHETYLYNLNVYLKSGVWLDCRYGEKREFISQYVCVAPAYDKDGCMIRSVGTWYRDIGMVWTKELANNET
jgi:hypothetical protein